MKVLRSIEEEKIIDLNLLSNYLSSMTEQTEQNKTLAIAERGASYICF